VSPAGPIRGRSHPIRFANDASSLFAIRDAKGRVSPAAPIRGRSHPIRFANGTWLAAHGATWLAAHGAIIPDIFIDYFHHGWP